MNYVAQKCVLHSADNKVKDEEVKNKMKRKRREDKRKKHKRSKHKRSKHKKRKHIKTDCDADSGEDTKILVSDHDDKKTETRNDTESEYPPLKRQKCMYGEELLAFMSRTT